MVRRILGNIIVQDRNGQASWRRGRLVSFSIVSELVVIRLVP